ncbi:gliding motility lipoprotein GldD [Ochrovirga pacifica]|uniref:gliding motility lipoprotein GldD n=1 Tax=Ochrovirga pacifica TaxID=1042376 RepID=UPI0002559551|nr:gliding motility lipoprotein GldD [Ochrovirga pacifica]
MKYFCLLIFSIFCISCKQHPVPKPYAFLDLKYKKPTYKSFENHSSFSFEISNQAVFTSENNHWANIAYPMLKADIQLTYQPVKNDILQLISDAEKLTYKHTLKADHIEVYPYENQTTRVYARIFDVSGDAASPIQFQATDSVKHFITGALYFRAVPNYDSILPAVNYVKKDIRHLIETLEWKP